MDESFGLRMRRQFFFWLGMLGFFVAFMWLFSDILLPFIAGMALAYFLDPVADWLQRMGASRMLATVIISDYLHFDLHYFFDGSGSGAGKSNIRFP